MRLVPHGANHHPWVQMIVELSTAKVSILMLSVLRGVIETTLGTSSFYSWGGLFAISA